MITIRKALESDALAIYSLRNRSIVANCANYYTQQQLALWTQGEISNEFITDVCQNFYVSIVNNQVIGSGKISFDSGMLDGIFVDPDFFGRGAAKQMLAFLEQLAVQHNLTEIKLDSTLNAAGFYRACGFIGECISTYHSPRGISLDCVPMKKSLIDG
ncbi:GNAT family N-acetyltransferase [Shewanella sairae]|nr:GNAT family N-acetyltransferase [Shewanella sairae]MCL1130201.1 GNAT family N-acetyltransferase [Shewanella sairae]